MSVSMENMSPTIEAFLKRVGVVAFEYVPDVDLQRIAIEDSLENQARIEKPLDEAAVKRYHQVLRDGVVFPPVILWMRPDGKLFVLDGNHRVAAHLRHGSRPDAYIVPRNTPVAVRDMIRISYNGQHGLTLSDGDRVRHALYLRNSGRAASEAARMMGIPLSRLQTAISIQNADERAAELSEDLPPGIWDSILNPIKVTLAAIKSDEGFVAATKLVVDAGMPAADVKELVTQLRPLGTAKKQLALVAEWRQNLDDAISAMAASGNSGRQRVGAQPPRVRAKLAISLVKGLDVARLAALPKAERDDVAEAVEAGIKHLQEVKAALEAGPTSEQTSIGEAKA